MTKPTLIEFNAAKLRELQSAVKATFTDRHLGEKQKEAWKEAGRRFHDNYDKLASPGGLAKAMSLLAAGDPATTEVAVDFLEADPWFFRSGYIKADVIKHLCRASLNRDAKKRLQRVVIARIHGQDTREFRAYCRLARAVCDATFHTKIAELGTSSVPLVARHAGWVLARLGPNH